MSMMIRQNPPVVSISICKKNDEKSTKTKKKLTGTTGDESGVVGVNAEMTLDTDRRRRGCKRSNLLFVDLFPMYLESQFVFKNLSFRV